jgi:hypothetical protein
LNIIVLFCFVKNNIITCIFIWQALVVRISLKSSSVQSIYTKYSGLKALHARKIKVLFPLKQL